MYLHGHWFRQLPCWWASDQMFLVPPRGWGETRNGSNWRNPGRELQNISKNSKRDCFLRSEQGTMGGCRRDTCMTLYPIIWKWENQNFLKLYIVSKIALIRMSLDTPIRLWEQWYRSLAWIVEVDWWGMPGWFRVNKPMWSLSAMLRQEFRTAAVEFEFKKRATFWCEYVFWELPCWIRQCLDVRLVVSSCSNLLAKPETKEFKPPAKTPHYWLNIFLFSFSPR